MSGPVIGAPLPMVNAREKVSGSAKFVADMKMTGMLHGKVLRSPYPHARIVNIDTTRAKAVLGVRLVVTGADTPPYLWGPLKKEHRILAVDKVRFAGEEVAAVVAVDEWTAMDALELIRVEYEELPAVLDPIEALEPGAPEIHAGTGNLSHQIHFERGNVDAALARAAAVYEATYEPHNQYAAYMEPMGTLAAVDERGRLTIWAPTQTVFYTREFVADALGIPETNIRVIQTMVGGGFGAKTTQDANTPLTAFLALKAGKPVRVINNRLEDFLVSRPGPSARIRLKMGLAKDGTIVAKDSTIIGDTGAYSGYSPRSLFIAAMRSDSLHRLENVRTNARLAFTNKLATGSFRGMGNPLMTFALDSHLTMLAGMIGMDPVDVLLRNAILTGETSVHGWHMSSCGLSQCIEQARDAIGWKIKHGVKQSSSRKRGVGIGCAIHVSSARHAAPSWDGATIIVRVNEDGRVLLVTGEGEMGQGAHTVLSQICAHELGIPIEHITVQGADTDVSPYSRGSIASRVTLIAGNATIAASRAARTKLLAAAAEKLDLPERELTIEDGVIRALDTPGRNRAAGELTIAQAVRAYVLHFAEGVYAKETYSPKAAVPYDPKTYYGNISDGYSFAAQALEVEVDTETGQVRVLDAFCADDCGKALNPLAVEGQTRGAMTQGIGWALYENLQFEDGRLVNADFADYTLPTAESVPDIRTALIESNEPNGPYGAKGASETAIVPTAGAIANAVYDAVGVRINSLPITPEKVLRALRAKEEAGKDA